MKKEKIMSKKLNSNHLKLIAILAMTIDHFTDLIYPGFPANLIAICLHIIGRLTAPIMWFFISEGYHYTHNVKNYMLRLFSFAVISHFAYCFAFGINMMPFSTGMFNQTGVMYSLFIAVLVLWLDNDVKMNIWLKRIIIFISIWSTFSADWSCIAVLAILTMYKNRGNLKKQMTNTMMWVSVYAIVSFFCVNKVYGIINLFVILVYPFLKTYNGERGKTKWIKWLFYIYYPLHLIIIGILRVIIYGNIPLLFN